jgi:glycosyltransferase involved in cell wall biosynthesis
MTFISVLICTFDRKDYILRSIESLFKQDIDKQAFEIVVVKGFQDEFIDEYLDIHHVKNVFLNERSLGKKIAMGIIECSGDFICFLDDDDEYEPNKLRKIYDVLNEYPDTDFIHNSILTMSEDGSTANLRQSGTPPIDFSFRSDLKKENTALSKFLRYRGDWYLSATCIRRSVIESVLNELRETNQSLDKFVFFAALNHGRRIMMIRDRLTRYRLHTSTTTYTGTEEEFIAKRRAFFENTVSVFRNIVNISENLPGVELAGCQLMQHRINLYFISDQRDSKISFREFVEFLGCLRIIRSRYQIIWICAFLIRKLSYRLSAFAYYTFFKMSFKGTL